MLGICLNRRRQTEKLGKVDWHGECGYLWSPQSPLQPPFVTAGLPHSDSRHRVFSRQAAATSTHPEDTLLTTYESISTLTPIQGYHAPYRYSSQHFWKFRQTSQGLSGKKWWKDILEIGLSGKARFRSLAILCETMHKNYNHGHIKTFGEQDFGACIMLHTLEGIWRAR